MTEHEFDQQLRVFLRWQAARTGGAPAAVEVAQRIAGRRRGDGAGLGRRPILAVAIAIGALMLALVGLAAIGAFQPRVRVPPHAGSVLVAAPDCVLSVIAPDGGRSDVDSGALRCPYLDDGVAKSFSYGPAVAMRDGPQAFLTIWAGDCGGCEQPAQSDVNRGVGVFGVELDPHAAFFMGVSRWAPMCAARCAYSSLVLSDDDTTLTWSETDLGKGTSTVYQHVFGRDVIDRPSFTLDEQLQIQGLAVSPDGRTVAAATLCTAGPCTGAIQVIIGNAQSRVPVELAGSQAFRFIAWAADGMSADVGVSLDGASGTTIFAVSRDGSARMIGLLETNPIGVTIGPGSTLAWLPEGGRGNVLEIADADGSNARAVVSDAAGPAMFDRVVAWAPDGSAVLVERTLVTTDSGGSIPTHADYEVVSISDGASTALRVDGTVLAWLPN